MKTANLFINPQTKLLRSGWRAFAFLLALTFPQGIVNLFFKSTAPSGEAPANTVFEVSGTMIFTYGVLVAWVMLISWLCLRFLDRMSLRSLGLALHSNWQRELVLGFAMSATMMTLICGLQGLAGSTKIGPNSIWINGTPSEIGLLLKDTLLALLLLILAGAFEELMFRGYAFQTLLRGMSPIVPIVLLSVYFGLGHWGNPNRTLFSTINTVLAGIWLSVAYLKTRSLWFPTALHFGWNWTMGAFFGLPVSGLRIPQQSIFESSISSPVWLTGGAYGPEGGAAASVVILLSIIFVWRTDWLAIAPEAQSASTESLPADDTTILLNLQNE
ncbi:MAG TPA: CPBP family intramembrane metalloprotease [Blastocatellia bacterium]|nr:CPBP family intramembrane metalloprotease [Blastocatellia bacterium]HMV86479.1 CPBP family intramembrane metalloprotease [Blastocatellia bacterium]HMX27334.1 CPBP family intramembrane metalloprotease [Blastocatellia bacterium]HMY74645.1 CPBP family intramembrane metalloprotease [Blastocatellia bacterium]HMZ18358.1 CPBP family intramembrane metalloprotease [Blastocatellia bacterium]